MKKLNYLWILFCCIGFLTQQVYAGAPDEVLSGGTAIGLRLQTNGVYVTGFSESSSSPGREAGVRIGDRILRIDNQPIDAADSIPSQIDAAKGAPVRLLIERDGKQQEISVQPKQAEDTWRLGLLVKDHVEGIGTLTYYDPQTGRYGALGHAINDSRAGTLDVSSGEVQHVTIITVNRSERGNPGALVGMHADAAPIGTIDRNCPQGVFGSLEEAPAGAVPLQIASPEEVERGEATILCTVDGETVEEYNVEITSFRADDPNGRHLRLTVTDPKLLEKTGGIVQGISGAPILQNGKLVGAVTHVLVDRPEQGYGIYIGNMLEADAAPLQQAA